jgi:hypothetical protein
VYSRDEASRAVIAASLVSATEKIAFTLYYNEQSVRR